MDEDRLIEERKQKIINLLKKDKFFSSFLILGLIFLMTYVFALIKITIPFLGFFSKDLLILLSFAFFLSAFFSYDNKLNFSFYTILAWLVFLSVKIRSSNISRLRDITTNGWTLGPDLDPFLFLRWAKYIVENGSLFVNDTLRYVPLGFDTKAELIFLPYLIAWFHKIAIFFGSTSVEQSAALFPVFMFALTVISFFLFTRIIFYEISGKNQANIIALISSFFLVVIPSLMPRTIAGIPEKESAAFFFMFLGLYFFIYAWKSGNKFQRVLVSILAGISTAMMALVWGGYAFLFFTIGLTIFVSYFLGQLDKNKILVSLLWLVFSFAFMTPFSTRYKLSVLLSSTIFLIPALAIFSAFIYYLIKDKKYFDFQLTNKIPKSLIAFIITIILGAILATLFFGPSFIPNEISSILQPLIQPITSRLGVTVAENRQPYFSEWSSDFGPVKTIFNKNIPILLWLFIFGSIYLFYNLIHFLENKKEKIYLTLAYSIFLFSMIFGRLSPESPLNGTSPLSIALYSSGLLIFIYTCGYYYFSHYKENKESDFLKLEAGLISLFILFFIAIVSARGAVRLIMVLVLPVSILVSYFVVSISNKAINSRESSYKIFIYLFAVIIFLSTLYSGLIYYQVTSTQAQYYAPSIYTQQWQKGMSWVRDNTPQNAVFGHWWDYGYWIQSIGERATVLDGGNAITYWNHLMGRHALTGPDNQNALEFLYSHNTTHFLIDSTDIGKYSAFSSIGSDENYDRVSYLPNLIKDTQQVRETKNSTIYLYPAGFSLDEDITYKQNETKIFLPGGKAGVGGILIEKDSSGNISSNPIAIVIYQGKQYQVPIRYAFEKEFIDFKSGIEAGVYIFPRVYQNGQLDSDGAMIYLSNRTVKSQLVRLYLYKENNPNFKLVHSEDDFLVEQIKSQQQGFSKDIIFYEGLRGPIRIWEIKYPRNMKVNQEYLNLDFPNKILNVAR